MYHHIINQSIDIMVETDYLPLYSNEKSEQYVWVYHVKITNLDYEKIKFIDSHFTILDDKHKMPMIFQLGGSNQQPELKYMESFSYSNTITLQNKSTSMIGDFKFELSIEKKTIIVKSPFISFDTPTQIPIYN